MKISNIIFCLLFLALCVAPFNECQAKGKKGPPPPTKEQIKDFQELEALVREANQKWGALGSKKLGSEMPLSEQENIFNEFTQLVESLESKLKQGKFHKTHSTELNNHLKKFKDMVKQFLEKQSTETKNKKT